VDHYGRKVHPLGGSDPTSAHVRQPAASDYGERAMISCEVSGADKIIHFLDVQKNLPGTGGRPGRDCRLPLLCGKISKT
jgi:hypothetical protein